MSVCSIVINEYGNEVKSNFYQKQVRKYGSNEKAMEKMYQGMAYSATNNGVYKVNTKVEAKSIRKEFQTIFDNVEMNKKLGHYEIVVKRPDGISINDLIELSRMDAVKESNFYSQGNGISQEYTSIEDSYFLTDEQVNTINPKLGPALSGFLKANNIELESVGKITDFQGNEMSMAGKADLVNKVISLVENRVDKTTLPEEVAHMAIAILGKSSPLTGEMMREVVNYPEYEQVLEEYEGIYFTEEEFRFEAAGRVVSNRLLKNNESNDKLDSWWKRVLNVIKSKLKIADATVLKTELDVFDNVANKILNEEILNEGKPFDIKEAFQSKRIKTATQEEAFDSLGETREEFVFDGDGKIKMTQGEPDEIGKETWWYTLVGGKIVTERVSNLYSALFKKNKTADQLRTIEKNSDINRRIGDAAHKLSEQFMGIFATKSPLTRAIATDGTIDGFSDSVSSPFQTKDTQSLSSGVEKLFEHITDIQSSINAESGTNGKADIYLEQLVYDKTEDRAGSIDVMVIFSDGSASIYDYKFMGMEHTTINGKVVVTQDWIHIGKEKSFNIQIGEYKRMLREKYGVTHFRETRIIPAFQRLEKSIQSKNDFDQLVSITMMDQDQQPFLPIPVANEKSPDPNVQKLIDTSNKRIKDLVDQIKILRPNHNNDQERRLLEAETVRLKRMIQALLVNQDINPFINDINRIIDLMQEGGLETLEETELAEYLTIIKSYTIVLPNMTKYSPNDSSTVSQVLLTLLQLQSQIEEKIKDNILESEDDKVEVKEFGNITQYFSNLSMINHPIFKKLRVLIKEMFNETMLKTRAFADEAVKQREAISNWAKNNNMEIIDVYRMMINKETGDLIDPLDDQFFKDAASARKAGKISFFRSHYKITETGKELYESDLAAIIEENEIFNGSNSSLGKAKIKSWKERNDLSKRNSPAWLNPMAVSKYTSLKNKESLLSNEYKRIQAEPELLAFYNWYVESNDDFNNRVPQKIKGNFVANIQKGFMQTAALDKNVWGAFKNHLSTIKNSVMVRENDSINEESSKIPLMYHDNFSYRNADGTFTDREVNKSEDLVYNIMMFANQVYLNEQRHAIEKRIQNLRIVLETTKARKRNKFGKATPHDGEFVLLDNDPKALSTFDAFTDSYIYGKTLRTKDRAFTIGKNTYSSNRLWIKLMSYMSVKSLAGNYVSGLGNLGGAWANSYIKGSGGVYYNPKQLFRAHKMMVERGEDDAYNRLTEFWNIERDHWAKEKADKLSASKLTQNLTYEKFYILQQKGDEFVANSILIAMMQNYGIDSEGNIQRLENLPESANPEGLKSVGKKSLLDSYSIVDDKIQIEGLSNEAFKDFRNRVKYVSRSVKGTNTQEDISGVGLELWGRSIMHFRNWVAPMVKERFGSLTYTEEVKEWEMGRYKAMFDEVVTSKLLPKSVELLGALTGLRKMGINEAIAEEQFENYKKANKDMQHVEFSDYLNARKQQVKSAIVEMRMITSLALIMMLMNMPDEDDKKFYTTWPLTRQLMRVLERWFNEMTFFANPVSVEEIIKSPIPAMRILVDIVDLLTNTVDEAGDAIFGEDNPRDKTGVGSKTKRLFPFASYSVDLVSDFMKDNEN